MVQRERGKCSRGCLRPHDSGKCSPTIGFTSIYHLTIPILRYNSSSVMTTLRRDDARHSSPPWTWEFTRIRHYDEAPICVSLSLVRCRSALRAFPPRRGCWDILPGQMREVDDNGLVYLHGVESLSTTMKGRLLPHRTAFSAKFWYTSVLFLRNT